MAVSNYFPEQNDPNNPQSGSGVGGTSILGGGGGGASSPGAAAPSSAPTGSGFTNLQKYIGVNSDQGGQLANAVTNQAGQGTEAYTTGLNNIASGIAGEYGANTTQYGNTVGEQDSVVNGLNTNEVNASGLAPAITTGANALNARQDLALNNSDAQQSLLKKEFGQGYQSGFGKLDSLILGQTNRAGLEAGIAGNKANIAAAGVNAQGTVDTAKGSMDAAKGRYDQSVTANTAWQKKKAADDAEAKRIQDQVTAIKPGSFTTPSAWGEGTGESYDSWMSNKEGWGEGDGESWGEFLQRKGRVK